MPMQPSVAGRVLYSQMKLRGGLDLVTPTLDLPSGFLRACENFEVSETGGYRRCDGYERFDGRSKPSDATFSIVQFAAYTNTPAVGNTLTDGGTGATGVIIVVESNYVVLTKIVGTHTVGNLQSVGGTPIGTMITPTITLTPLLIALYKASAADNYRADIGKPPGNGPVLGIATLVTGGTTNNTFAFRNHTDDLSQKIWKATTAGWVEVPLNHIVTFTVGTWAGGEPAIGEVITDAAGGETATIIKIVTQSGDWTAGPPGTAAGYIVITVPAPSALEGGALCTFSGGATATLSASTIIPIAPYVAVTSPAKYEMLVWNFSGQAAGLKLYGCDGVNPMFEFDGTTYIPIRTGTTPDTPKHIHVMANQLFGAFKSSAIHSAPGEPFNYKVSDNAGEIATGDNITGFMSMQGVQTAQSLAIYGSRQSSMLYGTGAAAGSGQWTLTRFDTGVGAQDYSVQRMIDAFSLDDPGVIKLSAVQDYGNFGANTLTANILPYIKTKRTLVANSSISREKSQYRVYFNDTSALFITIVNGRYLGSAPQRFQHVVYSTSNSDSMRVDGSPDVFFGTTDGYVMQLDKGTSFDGQAIEAYFDSNWETMGKPRIVKRFLKAAMEIQVVSYVSLTLSYALGYSSSSIQEPTGQTYIVNGVPSSTWDSSGSFWDQFTWDGSSFDVPTEISLKGRAETIRYRISSGTNYIPSYTINSLYTHYEDGRRMR